MSKLSMLFVWVIVAFGIAVLPVTVSGQAIEATIAIDTFQGHGTAIVRGTFTQRRSKNPRNLSLLRSVAGFDNLAARVSDVELFDEKQRPLTFTKLIDGEYLSEADITHFSYRVDLSVPKERNAAAHVSWFSGTMGILMLADLLPVGAELASRSATVTIPFLSLFKDSTYGPRTWPVFSSQEKVGSVYTVSDLDDAVFYFGEGWDKRPALDPKPIEMISSGDWNFESQEAVTVATEIHDAYRAVFRSSSTQKPLIAIAKFPQQTPPGQWQAETRGNNVTIISSDMPFKQQSVQRLHEQLRHELFHLWIPNGVNLTGNYDWFYEGFALYQSLKMAVALNRITFNDFLDTLSRAHTIDSVRTQNLSLIDASRNRFNGLNTQVYARGMLVAFLTDLELIDRSKGKRSVETVLRELYSKHKKPAAATDANTAVIALLKENPGVDQIVTKYVTGTDKIDWTNRLAAAGISDSDPGPVTTLKVDEKLNGRQKTLLDKLGYNNWRKLSPSSK